MTVQLLTPEGMSQSVPYHHVAVGTGTRRVEVAGQIGRDADPTGDLTGQVAQSLRNTALGLAGASYDQMLWMGVKKEAAYLPGC